MKTKSIVRGALAALALGMLTSVPARADDIEIFMGTQNANSISPPNVLIVVDNTSNWGTTLSNGNPAWLDELDALASVFGTLTGNVKIGLMVQAPGAPQGLDGGYVRFHIRPMNDDYRPALLGVIQTIKQKMLNNNKSDEQANNASYAQTLNEAYQYFRGGPLRTGFADKKRDCGPANDNNRVNNPNPGYNLTTSGPQALPSGTKYAHSGCGSASWNSNNFDAASTNAGVTYNSPIDPADPCQKNFIIYLSNGPVDSADGQVAGASNNPGYSLLRAAGGDTAVIPVVPNGETLPNYSDEWTRFMNKQADVSPAAGQQNIVTYTINTYLKKTGQADAHKALLESMSVNGGGRYCEGGDMAAIANCLSVFFNEILSINSVFASVSLPVSVNVRGTNLDQVYLGVFRPDKDALPRWYGNLKQYRLTPDVNGNLYLADSTSSTTPAVNDLTGQFTNDSISYWTSTSTYWSFDPRGTPPSASDSPDGPVVEKGGAAQVLRTDLATNAVTSRKTYTCVGCLGGSALGAAATTFQDGNTAITAAMLTPQGETLLTATERTDLINWARGMDNWPAPGGENLDGVLTDPRPSIHGDVLHSRPAIVSLNNDANIYVFYGANDGYLHAIRGGRGTNGGQEVWSFMPEEFFPKLKRLRDNSPAISGFNGTRTLSGVAGTVDATDKSLITVTNSSLYPKIALGMTVKASDNSIPSGAIVTGFTTATGVGLVKLSVPASSSGSKTLTFVPNPKAYFVDGSVTIYQNDPLTPTKIYLFAGMRRGGRFLYALDISNPTSPVFKWKKGCFHAQNPGGCDTGYGELGQTWSEPRVAKVKWGTGDKVVLIMGMGYDPNREDDDPINGATPSRTMGRGIMVIDAENGNVLWQASGASPTGATYNVSVSDMRFAIPADVTVIDRDENGFADRLYVGDTGGQLWRVDIGDSNAGNWTVRKIASIGAAESGADSDRRKLLYSPDVVAIDINNVAIMTGSGDREHPLNTTVQNRFYMFVDPDFPVGSPDPIKHGDSDLVNNTSANNFTIGKRGWYIDLEAGEKCTGTVITMGGVSYFGTNKPTPPAPNTCSNSLGDARYYRVDYLTGQGRADGSSYSSSSYPGTRFTSTSGGGLPPSPVGALIRSGNKLYQGVLMGPKVLPTGPLRVGDRLRTFWFKKMDRP